MGNSYKENPFLNYQQVCNPNNKAIKKMKKLLTGRAAGLESPGTAPISFLNFKSEASQTSGTIINKKKTARNTFLPIYNTISIRFSGSRKTLRLGQTATSQELNPKLIT